MVNYKLNSLESGNILDQTKYPMPSTRNGTSQDTPGKDLKGEGEEESSASEEDSCSCELIEIGKV